MPGGRPTYQPTPEDRHVVRSMAAAGFQEALIARVLSIAVMTLRKHYPLDLKNGRELMTALAVRKLAAAIDKGEAWAICFWLKCRAGWHERQVQEVTGANGGPINSKLRIEIVRYHNDDDANPGNQVAGGSQQPSEVKLQ